MWPLPNQTPLVFDSPQWINSNQLFPALAVTNVRGDLAQCTVTTDMRSLSQYTCDHVVCSRSRSADKSDALICSSRQLLSLLEMVLGWGWRHVAATVMWQTCLSWAVFLLQCTTHNNRHMHLASVICSPGCFTYTTRQQAVLLCIHQYYWTAVVINDAK